jgi:hypothetical protein
MAPTAIDEDKQICSRYNGVSFSVLQKLEHMSNKDLKSYIIRVLGMGMA